MHRRANSPSACKSSSSVFGAKRLSSIAESSLSDILITDGFREDRIRYARQLLDSLYKGWKLLTKRHPKRLEQRERLLVGFGSRTDGNVHPANAVYLVIHDFGEQNLLA